MNVDSFLDCRGVSGGPFKVMFLHLWHHQIDKVLSLIIDTDRALLIKDWV